jgi:prepilin-type N-terminal cleavage/methylation domain-containing protein
MPHTSRFPVADAPDQRGFSLIEVVVAMSILVVGLLGLAQVFYLGMVNASTSSANLIAREKAREAIESVHTARDTRTIAWTAVRNVDAPTCTAIDAVGGQPAVAFVANGGGVFLNGEQPLRRPGADGLVNTDDDALAGPEELPGANGRFEPGPPPADPDATVDDDDIALSEFWREIAICDVNADLRQIQVTVRYRVGPHVRRYTLMTYISSFS